jgi:dTDP-4-dehydrorhamnose reductase
MKVLVTGAAGQLGYDVCKKLDMDGVENKGIDIADCDLTDERAVTEAVNGYGPTHVVHCAAYTAVDKAESEKELCRRVNVDGTAYIARACAKDGAEMIYFSTDYVFDGFSKETPWEVDDPKEPVNTYGQTKYDGELAVQNELERYYIMRISWVFGLNGNNFIKTMLQLAKEKDEINVVDDQIGAPTWTRHTASLVADMLGSGKYGVYHTPNMGECSWYRFAKEIFEDAGVDVKVNPVSSSQYPTLAARPKNSRLSVRSLDEAGFARLPYYRDALREYLEEFLD